MLLRTSKLPLMLTHDAMMLMCQQRHATPTPPTHVTAPVDDVVRNVTRHEHLKPTTTTRPLVQMITLMTFRMNMVMLLMMMMVMIVSRHCTC